MPALIAASALLTCLGDGEQTFTGLLNGISGASPLRHPVPGPVNVSVGYHIGGRDPEGYARDLLAECVRRATADAGLDVTRHRVVGVVGTGLRELSALERSGGHLDAEHLHFGRAVPGVADVITVANACSAGGHAIALAQDMIEADAADAVVVGAADVMTTSMLAMIGRVTDHPADRVRPFDADRAGVLLGEGAGALVVVSEAWRGRRIGRLLATGLSCDARHETAPDVEGICRAIDDAFARSGRAQREVDLVVAHGTGTALNDPTECEALRRTIVARGGSPVVTAVKGALGHISGAAALANVDVALRALRDGCVPPVVGLRELLAEGAGLEFVRDAPLWISPRLVAVNAFGFGGVNAVTLLEPA